MLVPLLMPSLLWRPISTLLFTLFIAPLAFGIYEPMFGDNLFANVGGGAATLDGVVKAFRLFLMSYL